jgi:hypothetical protein
MRKATALVATAGLAPPCCGCDARTRKAFLEEVARHTYTENLGPIIVPSIVGASAPPGPCALNALCTDQAWRMQFASVVPEAEYVPSMFEVPDPHRPVKITTISRTRHTAPAGK